MWKSRALEKDLETLRPKKTIRFTFLIPLLLSQYFLFHLFIYFFTNKLTQHNRVDVI